jgi:DNA-binding MarR family transcriptional regulator
VTTVLRSEDTRRRREVSLLYLIKQVELAARQALEEVVEPAALTALQYTALTVLQRQPGITSAQLARNSFVRTQTMAEMIAFLLDRGLVERVRDESNRRQYLLSLSHHGNAVVESLSGPVGDVEQRMLAGFDAEEIGLLRESLLRCRRALSEAPLR